MTSLYLYVKALHIISVIFWMAGMLYLPRLYVYHTECAPGSEASERFKVMERRLLRRIVNPAMIASWIFGLWLVYIVGNELKTAGWFHTKLMLLVVMQIIHACLARWRRDFENDRNIHSAKFYRLINEVPAVLVILIVLLAIIKPF